MDNNVKMATTRRFGKLECIMGVLTTLGLAAVLAFLANDLYSVAWSTPSNAGNTLVRRSPAPPANAKVAVLHQKAEAPVQRVAATSSVESQTEAQEPPVSVGATNFARPIAHFGLSSEVSWHEFVAKAILAVIVLFALVIVGVLVFVRSFFALLRRHSLEHGPLIHIEYASGTPATVMVPFAANALAVAPTQPVPSPHHNHAPLVPAAESARSFDLGATFEGERNLKDEFGKRQEQAVLMHLLEDNLKLQGQIGLSRGRQE